MNQPHPLQFATRGAPLALLALILHSTALVAVQPNLVVNGDFEEPNIAILRCGSWITVPEGSAFITGWNINILSSGSANGGCDINPGYTNSVDLVVNPPGGFYANSGSQSVDLTGTDGTAGDSIFQDLPTTPGRTYTLTFATSSNGGPFPNALTVEWDGTPLATNSTTQLGTWVEHTFQVTASSTTTRLKFITNISGSSGPLLDTVAVVEDAEEPPLDTDGDGVPDSDDQCPGTPVGEPVDANGCSASQLDSDGDGVVNSQDQCPGTPIGEAVKANGCSASQLDSDGDGVANSQDQCPGTPIGEAVDAHGCSASQLDSDGDGVVNSQDQCPGTPIGEAVKANGCSASQLDSDGDRVTNNLDECPNSLGVGGTVVIGGIDTGVPNPVFASGCTISDLIASLAASAKNHGQFISSVAALKNLLLQNGTITAEQATAIQDATAQSSLP